MTRKDRLPKESNRGPQEKYLRSSLLSYSGQVESKVLEPNPNPDPELRKENPWLVHQLVRSQLFKLRTRPQDVAVMGAPFSGPEVNNASEWWQQYGAECPELQAVALRCFPPASAVGGERVFSALAKQWTKKRSTLHMTKASMLTYIFFNRRAMHRDEMPQQD